MLRLQMLEYSCLRSSIQESIPHQVTIHNETFNEEVNLSQCRFERGLDLAGCRFEKGLILSDTRVHGPLILDRVEIGCRSEKHIELLRQDRQRMSCPRSRARPEIANTEPPRAHASEAGEREAGAPVPEPKPVVPARFTNLRVTACLSMVDAKVYGTVVGNHLSVSTEFRLDRSRIHGDLKFRRAHIGELRTDSKVDPKRGDGAGQDKKIRAFGLTGGLDLTGAEISGDVRLVGVVVGGELKLQSANISGNLLCRDAGNTQANREFDAPPVTGRRQKWALTQQAFDSLLAYLAPDRNTAAKKYIEFRRNLVRFFEWRGCSAPEDYADEVMNRGAKRIAEGEDIRDPAMYLVGIARMFLFENRHQRAREQQPVSEVLVQSKTTPYEIEYDRDQRVVCLRRCLQQVSPESRKLILLYYEGDKSEKIDNRKKLMELLKIPANTLRARALRIRERLQSCAEQCMNKRTSS